MDPVRSPMRVGGGTPVGERQGGGNKRQADAFRRALQEAVPAQANDAVAPKLQPQPPGDRKSDGTAHYVDVIA